MTNASQALDRRLGVLTGDDPVEIRKRFHDLVASISRKPEFDAAARLHAALADPRRLLVLSLLKRRGELCACELQAALGISHATISHHMDQLLQVGLVDSEQRGKWTYYKLRKTSSVADLP